MSENRRENLRQLKRRLTPVGTTAGGAVGGYLLGKKLKGPKTGLATMLAGGVGGHYLGHRMVRGMDLRHVAEAGMDDPQSSMIRGIRTDPEGTYIKFNTGKVYRYNMGGRLVHELRSADSVGKHFNELRKRGVIDDHEYIGKL